MKKFNHVLALCAVVITAVSFFAACGGESSSPETGVTYTLAVSNISVSQGDTKEIEYTLTASDGSDTSAIPVTFADDDSGSTLTINGSSVTAGQNETPAVHNFTATAKKDGATVATKTFTVTVTSLADIEAALLVIEDMEIYRVGGSATSRTIEPKLYDADGEEITNPVFLATVTYEYTSDTLTITNGVIQDSKAYAEEDHDVSVTATIGTDELEAEFVVTVSKLMYDVKFYHETQELTDLAEEVEHGDTVTDPGDPVIDDFDFVAWLVAIGGAEFDFDTPITANTNIYASGSNASTEYSVVVTVTFTADPEAELLDGEYVWIAHGAYNETWDKTVLTNQGNNVWSATLTGIPLSRQAWTYDIFAVKSPDTFGDGDWGIRFNGGNINFNNATTPGVIKVNVNSWRGRIVINEGELLENPGFEGTDSGNWTIAHCTAGWTITGLNSDDFTNMWVSGDPPGSHGGGKHFRDFNGNSSSTYYLDSGATLSITQAVSASENGLAAGQEVTLSVWIALFSVSMEDPRLVVGDQVYEFNDDLNTTGPTGASAQWQQISKTFTLTTDDIDASGNITVGLEYEAGNGTCRTMFDDFSFVVAD